MKSDGLVRHYATMWQHRILLCKITFFQNDNPNRQKIIFFGAQMGLWDGRRGSVALFFRKKGGGEYFNK